MFSDIENLDIMLGERHSEREESVNKNSVQRPESANSNTFGNTGENIYLNPEEMGFGNDAVPGHNSASGNSSVEINRLSSELNSRLSREMDEMMSSVNVQIKRAISDAINNQTLLQTQNVLRSGSGHLERSGRVDGTFRPRDRKLIPKTSAMGRLEKIQEVSQSVHVLMTNPQTKLATRNDRNVMI